MGEVVGLRIGNYDFLSYKNTFGDLLSIFSKQSKLARKCKNI